MFIDKLVDSIPYTVKKKPALSEGATYAIVAVSGLVVGVAIGMLFAPKSGRKIRKAIKKKSSKTVNQVKDLVHQGTTAAEEAKDSLTEKLEEAVDSFKKSPEEPMDDSIQ